MKILYHNIDVVDCTADPHVVDYKNLEAACKDVLKVCESATVFGIERVTLESKDKDEIPFVSDWYSIDLGKGPDKTKWVKAEGKNAEKHKIKGLYFYREADFSKEIVDSAGRISHVTSKVPKNRHLPPGLTGVKEAIKTLLKDPDKFKVLTIIIVWSQWMTNNCSDYIRLDVENVTVDYSNQDWYIGTAGYKTHLAELSKLLGIEIPETSE
ncbi:MAG: hypothetical protein QW445_07435 [Candidatus Bathyarchaeia archaeon]